MDTSQQSGTPIDAPMRRRWIERHDRKGSTPGIVSQFASIETALLFDAELRRLLHPEVRRFAVCLASRLEGKSSLVKASAADIASWCIDARSTIRDTGRIVYREPWALLTEPLEDLGILEDPHRRPKAKRELYLRLCPVFTDRRQAMPLERPTTILKKHQIPTATVPFVYFHSLAVASLPTPVFFLLMVLHSLTDMRAWGGVDPAHVRAQGGMLLMSDAVCQSIGLDEEAATRALLQLAGAGLVWFVPSKLEEVATPSSLSTYEWASDDGSRDADTFLVRPCQIWQRGDEQTADRVGRASGRRWLPAIVADASADTVRLVIDGVPRLPQYTQGSDVLGDRFGASMKAQIRKAAPEIDACCVDVRVEVWAERAPALVHVYKLVSDALKGRVFGDDSSYVVKTIDIRRGSRDKKGRPYIRIHVCDADDAQQLFSRKVYVQPHEWRPPARRRQSPLSDGWDSYAQYSHWLQQSVSRLEWQPPASDFAPKEMHVHVTSDSRFDPDNVALVACDVATALLSRFGQAIPVDARLLRVLVTHSGGDPLTTVELG